MRNPTKASTPMAAPARVAKIPRPISPLGRMPDNSLPAAIALSGTPVVASTRVIKASLNCRPSLIDRIIAFIWLSLSIFPATI